MKTNVFIENGELYVEQFNGTEWETLPVEKLNHNTYEVYFYDKYGTAATVDEAVIMYRKFEREHFKEEQEKGLFEEWLSFGYEQDFQEHLYGDRGEILN